MPAKRPDQLDTRAPLSTDWMIVTPTGGPAFKCAVSAIGVTSLNQLVGATAGALLTGAVVLKQGTNVTLATSGNEITINSTAAAGGVTSMNSLAGALNVVAGANITVTASDTSITIAGTVSGGVTSINTLTGAVVLAAGTNVTLGTVGNTITVNSTAAGGVTTLNGLAGALNVVAGANITVTASGTSITIAGAAGGGGTQTINAQTGTTYTLVLTDAQTLVTFGNASDIMAYIPTNATVAFPIGTGIDVLQLGVGNVSFNPQAGVTLNGTPGLRTRERYSGGTLIKLGTDTWVLVGDTKS